MKKLATAEPNMMKRDRVSSFTQGAMFSDPKKQVALFSVLLGLLTLAAYNTITRNSFLYFDDQVYILDNAHVKAGLTWDTVKWAFTTFDVANWHPLTWISHCLDIQLFGMNPAGHHYVNVLLHAANAIVLFLLLRFATGKGAPSFIVAGLFALHPVNVESVAWAAERKNVLSMLFLLLALRAYGKYARYPGLRRYLEVMLFFALGLMSKPQVITFPFVLLLWDYWPLKRIGQADEGNKTNGKTFAALLLEKIPLFSLSLISAVVTMHAQHSGYAVRTVSEYSLSSRLGNALFSYIKYLRFAFWPAHLAPMYPHPGSSIPVSLLLFSGVILIGITAGVVYQKRRPYLFVGWFWFLGTLVPMIGLVQVGEQGMADRYAYIPIIGIFLMVVWGIGEFAQSQKVSPKWIAVLAGAVLIVLSGLTYHQLGYWRNSETLWRYTLSVTKRNYMAEVNLATALAKQGHPDEAIAHFHLAEDLHQYPLSEVFKLGMYEQNNGRLEDAIHDYLRVAHSSPDPKLSAAGFGSLGFIYLQMGKVDLANESYRTALARNPDDVPALVGMAVALIRAKDFSGGATNLSRAVTLKPNDVAYLLLADAYGNMGLGESARKAHEQAQRLSQDMVMAENTVKQLLAR